MSFVHGSQGCVAYYRSHLSRHFKEPCSAVSSSMTEDAAVFGGLNNMIDGLANTYKLYEPSMIAVSTTCMAEVIGDDLQFVHQQREGEGVGAAGLRRPLRAHAGVRRQPHHRLRQHAQGNPRALLEGQGAYARRAHQHHPGLRWVRGRQQPRAQANARSHGRAIHHSLRRLRPVRHALRRAVPHVRRRDQRRRHQGVPQRQGDAVDAGALHDQDPGVLRRARPDRRRRPLSDGRRGDR